MTVYGNIGVARRQAFLRKQSTDTNGAIILPNSGIIAGTVQENGVAIAGAQVRLYHKHTGILIETLRCDAGGAFKFTGLNPLDPAAYYAIAFDPAGGINYNALIYDQLTAAPDSTVPSRSIAVSGFTDNAYGAHIIGKLPQTLTFSAATSLTLSGGNRIATNPGNSGGWFQAYNSVVTKTAGKWYYELTATHDPSPVTLAVGVCAPGGTGGNAGSGSKLQYVNTGQIRTAGTYYSYGAAWGDGDIIGCLMDLDARTISFTKNGVSQGVAFTTSNGVSAAGGTYHMCIDEYHNSGTDWGIITMASLLQYFPPTGYSPLA